MNIDLELRALKAQVGALKNTTDLVHGADKSTDGNVAVFDGQSGKKIKDSGKSLSSYVEGASSSTDGNIPLFYGTSGKKIKDGGIPIANLFHTGNLAVAGGSWASSLVVDGATVSGSPTYTIVTANYFRIGSLVICTIDLNITAAGGASGTIRIGGLPVPYFGGFKSDIFSMNGYSFAAWASNSNSTLMGIMKPDGSFMTFSDLGAGINPRGVFWYMVASGY